MQYLIQQLQELSLGDRSFAVLRSIPTPSSVQPCTVPARDMSCVKQAARLDRLSPHLRIELSGLVSTTVPTIALVVVVVAVVTLATARSALVFLVLLLAEVLRE